MILRREMMLSMCFNWIRWIIIITKRHTHTNTFARSIHHHSSILLPFRDPLLRGKVMFAVVMFSFMKRIHSYDEKKEKTHAFEWYAVASSVWTHFVCSYFFSLATLKRSEKNQQQSAPIWWLKIFSLKCSRSLQMDVQKWRRRQMAEINLGNVMMVAIIIGLTDAAFDKYMLIRSLIAFLSKKSKMRWCWNMYIHISESDCDWDVFQRSCYTIICECVCKTCCEGENFTRLPSESHQKHTHQMCAEKKKEIIYGSCSFSSSSSFEGETKRCGNGDRAMMMMTLVGCFTRSQIRCADGKCGTHRTCTLTLTHKAENERAQEQASEWL